MQKNKHTNKKPNTYSRISQYGIVIYIHLTVSRMKNLSFVLPFVTLIADLLNILEKSVLCVL